MRGSCLFRPGRSHGERGQSGFEIGARQWVWAVVKGMFWAFSLCPLVGCATTDDPRQGGLFSYNPKAYEQRLAERRAALQEIQAQQQSEEDRSRQLQDGLAAKKSNLDRQKSLLDALDNDLTEIRKGLDAYLTKTSAQSAEKSRLENEVNRLKSQIQSVRDQSRPTGDEPGKRIAALKAEIDELLKLTLLLTD
jgi:archaellum component FlaC